MRGSMMSNILMSQLSESAIHNAPSFIHKKFFKDKRETYSILENNQVSDQAIRICQTCERLSVNNGNAQRDCDCPLDTLEAARKCIGTIETSMCCWWANWVQSHWKSKMAMHLALLPISVSPRPPTPAHLHPHSQIKKVLCAGILHSTEKDSHDIQQH